MECIFDQKAGVNHQRNGELHMTDVLDVKRVISCVVVPFAFCCETTLAGCTYRYVVVGFLSAKHLYAFRSAQPNEQTATQPWKSRIDAFSNLLNYKSGESDITISAKAR